MRVTIFTGLLLLVAAASTPFVMAQPGDGERPARPPRQFDPAQFFERHDTDGDGALSAEEAPERMKERFETIDADGDGKITLEEFQAARPQRPERGEGEGRPARPPRGEGDGERPARPPRDGDDEGRPARPPRGEGGEGGEGRPDRDPAAFAERIFLHLDKNEDGLLTLDEVPEQHQDGFKKILEGVDAEGVTLEQYQAAMAERFAERRAGGEGGEGRPPRGDGEGRPARPPRGEGDGDRPQRDRPEGDRPHGPNPERMMGHMLENLDANEDGEISRDEVLAKVGEHFDSVDTNNNGILDEEELGAAMEKFRPPHRPGTPPAGE